MRSGPIKSVHITNYYHRNSGGISTSYNNLMAAAQRHRRHVRLIVPGETDAVEEVNDFARIYYVPARYSPLFDKRYRVMMPWQYMLKDSAIRKVLLAEMPDIIEVTDKYTLSLIGPMIRTNQFKKIGRPMLVHFSCERMDDNVASFLMSGRFGKWLAESVIRNYTMPAYDFHIANSAYTAEEFYASLSDKRGARFTNWAWRFFRAPRVDARERVFVCPRGVDAVHFTPDRRSTDVRREMRERAGLPDETVILLYAGRISPEKNIGLLVEMMKVLAADKATDYRLLVAGAGPQAEWLANHGEKIGGGKIFQLGHLDKETLADYYANADVFVHPNPREPFGIAPLEAMASGVPTVAPNAGGILSYATAENAWLVEPTSEQFAAAVREVIEHRDARDRKIEKALEAARANTREASTDRLFETYDRLWEEFNERRGMFTDLDENAKFDFINGALNSGQQKPAATKHRSSSITEGPRQKVNIS